MKSKIIALALFAFTATTVALFPAYQSLGGISQVLPPPADPPPQTSSQTSSSGSTSGDSVLLGVAAFAAYVAFAAFALLHDGGRAAPERVESERMESETGPEAVAGAENVAEATSFATPSGAGRSLGALDVQSVTAAGDARGGNLHMQFIVKFKGDAAVEWRDRYIEDPAAARAAFARFAAQNPAFANLRLERMTYGGEATLSYDGDAPADARALEALSRQITARLNAAEDVDYAEPNLVGVREDVDR